MTVQMIHSLLCSSVFFHPPALWLVSGPFRDCLEAQESGHSISAMYLIKPDEAHRPVQAWCEQDIDNGGWTVIQSRRDGSVNFFRNWENYKVTPLPLPCSSFFFNLSFLWPTFESLAHPKTAAVQPFLEEPHGVFEIHIINSWMILCFFLLQNVMLCDSLNEMLEDLRTKFVPQLYM